MFHACSCSRVTSLLEIRLDIHLRQVLVRRRLMGLLFRMILPHPRVLMLMLNLKQRSGLKMWMALMSSNGVVAVDRKVVKTNRVASKPGPKPKNHNTPQFPKGVKRAGKRMRR